MENKRINNMPIRDEKWEEKRRIIDEHNKFRPNTNYEGRKCPLMFREVAITLIIFILLYVLVASLTPINTSGENETKPHPIIRIGKAPIVF